MSSSVNLETYQNRIKELNESLNIFLDVKSLDQDQLKGKEGKKLYGMPIAIKDNINVKDWEITCGSKILKGYKAPYNATVIERLVDEGAFLIGRVNMDEFAFGSSCETSAYGPTKNPWDPERVPGGSSGGSAACMAADMAFAALGSDTGGSIRQPAALCGIVGLKPTYGRVSRYGLIAFGSSLDQIGPLTKTVKDAALTLEVIAGYDPKDSTSVNVEVPEYTKHLDESIKGKKIGIPKEFFGHDVSPDIEKATKQAIELLEKEGAQIKEVSLPNTEYAVAVYYVVGPCEASSNLARFDGVRFGHRDKEAKSLLEMYMNSREEGFGAEAKRRIILGTFALSSGYYDAYYLKAMRARHQMIEDFNNAFKEVDFLVAPTSPQTAFKLGEKTKDPLQMYLSDIFTISANLAGVPAISVPCGFDSSELPIGIQFMAKPFDEKSLLNIAHVYEERSGFKDLKPARHSESSKA